MSGNEILALAMFASFIALVFTGFPVAWILGGLAVLFTAFADLAYPGSIYHAMTGEQVFVILITIVMTTVLLLGLIQRERHGLANIGFESVLLLLLYCGGMALLLGGAVTGG